MQLEALAALSIGVIQPAALTACTIYNYLHAAEQHFVCHSKQRRVARSVAYAYWENARLVIY
jgi:hypothetical protein